MSGVWAVDFDGDKQGKRIQLAFKGAPDAFTWLIAREKEHGKWWAPLMGFISPVIPVMLQLARPQGDIPVAVDLRSEPERFVDLIGRWLAEQEQVRNRLKVATGVWRWRHLGDLDHAIRVAPSQYLAALTLWRADTWCWREKWE